MQVGVIKTTTDRVSNLPPDRLLPDWFLVVVRGLSEAPVAKQH